MTIINKINGENQSCSNDAQQNKAIIPASDQTDHCSDMSFDSEDLPIEQWGRTQVLAKLNNWMNPFNETNAVVTEFINELMEQGFERGTVLRELTREDLDEIFPNKYLGYKKTILKHIESLNQPSSTISSATVHDTRQQVESVQGINSQSINGPASYTAGDTYHEYQGPVLTGKAQFHSSSFGEYRGNFAHNNKGSQNYTDNTSYTSQDNRSIQVPSTQSSGGLLLSLGAFMAGLSQMTGESGICSIGGRSVRYHVSGRLHSFKWVYDAKVMDLATQVQGSSRHYKSRTGALEHALRDLGIQLKARDILAE